MQLENVPHLCESLGVRNCYTMCDWRVPEVEAGPLGEAPRSHNIQRSDGDDDDESPLVILNEDSS